ncbi:MAG TPA: cation:proton antiporter [Flavisolibacter sp.]|nr:cation:proton antiporter [Flavisolibacter sp.]
MHYVSTELLLIILCCMVVLSYLFSIVSRRIRVPSVLLLLFAGIGLRFVALANNIVIPLPSQMIEALGVVGLIMIVLEAGLDLKIQKEKLGLIRNSFFSALFILLISTALVTGILYYWLREDPVKSLVYAIPLCIMSSSIVIPSIHHLTERKREFLIYEASFSDIIGIIFFNYFIADEVMTLPSLGIFGFNFIVSILLSFILSIALFFILRRTKLEVKFFLIFSLLILVYAGGKMLHLPSLMIILAFGLLINNWEAIQKLPFVSKIAHWEMGDIRTSLHSITAESSFLVRTFFFLLFGFSIDLKFLYEGEVWLVGSLIVAGLFLIRLLYMRFSLKTNVFPESFFIPRGLITIVLFYKIPAHLKLATFNDGILFFVVLSTSIILALGMLFYKASGDDVIEEPQFAERKELL